MSYYTPAHEYYKVEEGKVGFCGITDFAQSSLGDMVSVELPQVGDEFEAGDVFGVVESVKSALDVHAPVSGEIVEINEVLQVEPELVNSSAEDEGWLVKIKIKDAGKVNDLMEATAYKKLCEEEA